LAGSTELLLRRGDFDREKLPNREHDGAQGVPPIHEDIHGH